MTNLNKTYDNKTYAPIPIFPLTLPSNKKKPKKRSHLNRSYPNLFTNSDPFSNHLPLMNYPIGENGIMPSTSSQMPRYIIGNPKSIPCLSSNKPSSTNSWKRTSEQVISVLRNHRSLHLSSSSKKSPEIFDPSRTIEN
jgi:hypothetical protein